MLLLKPLPPAIALHWHLALCPHLPHLAHLSHLPHLSHLTHAHLSHLPNLSHLPHRLGVLALAQRQCLCLNLGLSLRLRLGLPQLQLRRVLLWRKARGCSIRRLREALGRNSRWS